MNNTEKGPREVWINPSHLEDGRLDGRWPCSVEATSNAACVESEQTFVRYLRADLVPSVPPVGERERRVAERLIFLESLDDCCVCDHPRSEHGGDDEVCFDDDCVPRCRKFVLAADHVESPIIAEARAILSSTAPVPESEPSDLLKIECSIGGGYEMPDGRSFWIDGPVAREMTRRVAAALGLQVKESR